MDTLSLYAALYAVAAYLATSALMSESTRHVITFIGTIPLYIIAFGDLTGSRYRPRECFSLMVILAIIAIGYAAAENRKGYRLLYDCSRFFCLYMISTTAVRKTYSFGAFRAVELLAMIAPVLLFAASFSGSAYIMEDGRKTSLLTLGMTNPNQAAMVILGTYGVLMIIFRQSGRKLILFIEAAILEYLLILTNSRTAIFASFLITAYTLFLYRTKIPKNVILCFTLAAIVFVPVYLYLYYGLGLADVRLDVAGDKTLFSGRQHTFMGFLALVKDSVWTILFGNLGEAAFGNAHNGPLAVMTSIGVVGLAVTYWNFIGRLLRINTCADTPESRTAVMCIVALYFQSCGEAGLFGGQFMLVSFLYIYMVFAQKKIIMNPRRRSEPA